MPVKDVYNFMDGGVTYMHMNFKAANVKTGSEELFFAELIGFNQQRFRCQWWIFYHYLQHC
jgi:hypothetical protein